MKILKLRKKIEKQKKINTALYRSIPTPSHDDPLNKKAEPVLQRWREGSKKLKELLDKLYEVEKEERESFLNSPTKRTKTFINSFGEATTREITCDGYKRAEKRMKKEIMSFISAC